MPSIHLSRGCRAVVLFCFLATAALVSRANDDVARRLHGLDAEVLEDMHALHVPGVAIGVVRDGRVIFTKGYGVRKYGTTDPIDADTIFAIGSISKSFTSSVIATLVDEGRLQWSRPVRDYWPGFTLADSVSSELATPVDLLTHRTGLSRHDFLRYSKYESRGELMARLRYLEPSLTFRDGFLYNNLTYTAAGFMAEQITGTTWEELVRQRLFTPLEMTRSNTSSEQTQRQNNFASPHLIENGALSTVPFYVYQRFGVGPNGAVNSTVTDLLKYAVMQLDGGRFSGRQIISAAQVEMLHRPVLFAGEGPWGASDYALGWFITEHRHRTYVQHGGAIIGFTAQLILDPETKTGVVVLNNLGGSELPQTLAWSIADRLAGLPSAKGLAVTQRLLLESERDRQQMRERHSTRRVRNTKPTLPLEAYTGEYFNQAYGAVRVERDGDGLAVRFDALSLTLKHYHYDTFEYNFDQATWLAQFQLSAAGAVGQLLLPLEPAAKPLVFVKRLNGSS